MREHEGSKKSAASSQHVKPWAAEVEKPHSIQQKTVYRNEVR